MTAENQSSCYDHCRVDQVGCPLFFNEKIIEQPTDLTKLTEKYTQAALKFVKNSVRKQQKPFFLYLAYHQTHHPQFASELKSAFGYHPFLDVGKFFTIFGPYPPTI